VPVLPYSKSNVYIGPVPPDILIVRLGAMGDVLLTTPLLRALRIRHPQAKITFVTRTPWLPLLEHNPRLTRVIGWNPAGGEHRLLDALGGSAAIRAFSHRLDLQNNLRTRLLRLRVGGAWTTYPAHRVARATLIHTKRDRYRDRRPVAERYFDAARGLDVVPDQGSLEIFVSRSATDAAERRMSRLRHQVIAIAPGASHATKRWPVHHWIALSRRLTEQGNDVVVIGGPMDQAAATEIAGAIDPAGIPGAVENAAGLDVPTTAALLRRCRALVAGDTGQMHLATAVGTPVLALFGPTVEAFGFFPYHAKAAVLQVDLPCRPCSAHGGPVCPLNHHRCLQDLQPALVLEALRKLPR
jgi:heptosyltransferase-2